MPKNSKNTQTTVYKHTHGSEKLVNDNSTE